MTEPSAGDGGSASASGVVTTGDQGVDVDRVTASWPVLSASDWRACRDAHLARADQVLADVRERRRRGEKHPVEDFMFTYYTLRPGQVSAWHPGVGVRLADADEFATVRDHVVRDGLALVDVESMLQRRADTLRWVHRLLTATASRTPNVACFGMHEWAMVYGLQPGETRHPYLPLRFDPEGIREVVDQVGLRCSHYDAFRFFTPDAAPRNQLQLTRADQLERDQPGCLHVTMDLYKWAGKLYPLVDSELLLDCYELARDVRELDMRASAYDLQEWGYAPVRVETASGRAEYAAAQRAFSQRGEVLRQRLLQMTSVAMACASGL